MSAPLYSGFSTSTGTVTGLPNIPAFQGPKGDPGADGSNGAKGINSFTKTTGNAVQVLVNALLTVPVEDSTWIGISEYVYLESGGYYQVISMPNATSVTLKTLGYPPYYAPGFVIPLGSKLTPGGLQAYATGGVFYGTEAEYNTQLPAGPGIWILSDSVPPYQLIPIPA